jgi:hypothetical protein
MKHQVEIVDDLTEDYPLLLTEFVKIEIEDSSAVPFGVFEGVAGIVLLELEKHFQSGAGVHLRRAIGVVVPMLGTDLTVRLEVVSANEAFRILRVDHVESGSTEEFVVLNGLHL